MSQLVVDVAADAGVWPADKSASLAPVEFESMHKWRREAGWPGVPPGIFSMAQRICLATEVHTRTACERTLEVRPDADDPQRWSLRCLCGRCTFRSPADILIHQTEPHSVLNTRERKKLATHWPLRTRPTVFFNHHPVSVCSNYNSETGVGAIADPATDWLVVLTDLWLEAHHPTHGWVWGTLDKAMWSESPAGWPAFLEAYGKAPSAAAPVAQ